MSANSQAKLPLDGIRIANFGWVWAGPVTGQTLAFLGADVVKIESKSRVDLTRTLPPFADGEPGPDRSLSNHACWAGNGSLTLNLKKPEAVELAKEFIATCDAVVENFGPGVMEKMGLGFDALQKVKPDIVLFSMPAAGLDGPLKNVRTYGMSLTSLTGVDSTTGYAGGGPVPFENAFADPYNGILGAFAVLTALAHRNRTGEGQHVDYSQQEAVMQMMGPAFMDYELNGRVAGPLGNRHPCSVNAPHGVFPCAGDDAWISIAVTEDSEWDALVGEMGGPGWASEQSFASAAARVANANALGEHIAKWTAGEDRAQLAESLQAAGIAAAPVLGVADLLADPQYSARETFVEVDHPLGFRETIYGAYVKTSAAPAAIAPGPAMGRDNERIMKDVLGMSDDRFDALVADEVIF